MFENKTRGIFMNMVIIEPVFKVRIGYIPELGNQEVCFEK